jgi:hypothetical protein
MSSTRCPHHSTPAQACHGCQLQNFWCSVGIEGTAISRPHVGHGHLGLLVETDRRVHPPPPLPREADRRRFARHPQNRLSVKNHAPIVWREGECARSERHGGHIMPSRKCDQCVMVKRGSMYIDDSSAAVKPFLVYLCRACGTALGFRSAKVATVSSKRSSRVSSKKSRRRTATR